MKRIFTLLLGSLFSLSLLAYDANRLSISTVSNSTMDFKVEIDGRKYAMIDNSLTLRNLAEGNHNVRIYREKKKNGKGFGFGRKQEIIYATNIFLRRGFHLDITVNRFGKVLVDERRITSADDDWFENGDEEYDYDNGYDDGNWDNGMNKVMKAQEFETVKQSISKEWLESNRLSSIKFIIDRNYFTVQQTRELMMLFSFESNKLEVAKHAYKKTVDNRNYIMVNDLFSFSSSKDELARFIRDAR